MHFYALENNASAETTGAQKVSENSPASVHALIERPLVQSYAHTYYPWP